MDTQGAGKRGGYLSGTASSRSLSGYPRGAGRCSSGAPCRVLAAAGRALERASPDCVGARIVTHKQLISEGLLEDRPRAALGECVIGAVDDVHVAAITEPPDR